MWVVTPHFFYLILPYSYSVLFSVCILLFRKLKMGPSYSYSIFPRHISWIFSITVHSYCITHYTIHMCCSYILYAHCLKKNTQISQLSSSAYEHIPCGPVYFVSISPLPPSPPPDRQAGIAGVGGGGSRAGEGTFPPSSAENPALEGGRPAWTDSRYREAATCIVPVHNREQCLTWIIPPITHD